MKNESKRRAKRRKGKKAKKKKIPSPLYPTSPNVLGVRIARQSEGHLETPGSRELARRESNERLQDLI